MSTISIIRRIFSPLWGLDWATSGLLSYIHRAVFPTRGYSGQQDVESSAHLPTTGENSSVTNTEAILPVGKLTELAQMLPSFQPIKMPWLESTPGWLAWLLNRLASPSASPCVAAIATLEQPSQQNIIAVGIFSIVHRLGDTLVRKVPSPSNNGDFPGNCEAIRSEARIYNLLGNHPRIAECLSRDQTEDFIDLRFYANGTLLDYIKRNGVDSSGTRQRRWRWGQQIIEAIVLIHDYNIIHSDLALRQYLLDDHLDARLSDFGVSAFPGHNALGFENASHCLPRDFDQPNTIQSDLFALGSTLYELEAGEEPYCDIYDDETIERYTRGVFPDVSRFFCGEIILRCWKTEFVSAQEVLLSYQALKKPEF